MGPGHGFEPRRRAGDRLLAGHQCRAPQHPRVAQELVGGRRLLPVDLRLEPVEAFPGLESEEVRAGERIGHGH